MRTRLALCTLALLAAAPLAAQKAPATPPAHAAGHAQGNPMKAHMIAHIERQKKNVLDYVNIAPDSMLRFRSTPGVRSYAEQIAHIAGANVMILSRAFGTQPMAMPDTARIHNDKAALREFVTQSYDWVARLVRDAQPAQFEKETTLFGMTRSGHAWVDGVLEHGTWTLGQTVPYLRMNGVTPPSYLPF